MLMVNRFNLGEKIMSLRMIGVAVLLGGVGFGATPYITTYQMMNAVDNLNASKFNQHVNYAKLSNNLSIQVMDEVEQLVDTKIEEKLGIEKDNVFYQMVSKAGHMAVKVSLKQVVTPDNVSMLINSGILSGGTTSVNTVIRNDADNSNNSMTKNHDDISLNYRYLNFDTFLVSVKNETYSTEVELYLEREGLIDWQLTNIKLNNMQLCNNFIDCDF